VRPHKTTKPAASKGIRNANYKGNRFWAIMCQNWQDGDRHSTDPVSWLKFSQGRENMPGECLSPKSTRETLNESAYYSGTS